MKAKKILVICSSLLICVLIFSGCHMQDTPNLKPDIQIKRDLTADAPVKYEISDDVNCYDVYTQADYAFDSKISTLSAQADAIVRGVIQEVVFTSFDGDAFTAVSLAVDECYKGDLEQGDLITILHRGGYIPLQDHISRYNDVHIFESFSDEEIANTILHEAYEGESDPQVGDYNIYFIDSTNPNSGLPEQAFQRVRGTVSLFRIEPDGETVSRINPDMPREEKSDNATLFSDENNTQPYGNELFSLQEIVDIVSADE